MYGFTDHVRLLSHITTAQQTLTARIPRRSDAST